MMAEGWRSFRPTAFNRRVERGRRFWDRASGIPMAPDREALFRHVLAGDDIDVRAGHRVLDVGCGSGAWIPALCSAVGPGGRVVGVDLSGRMLDRARDRVAEHGLTTVRLRQDEMSRADVEPGVYDRAVAVFSLAAMADATGALRTVHRALRPGGRLLVLDVDLVPRWPAAPLTWLARAGYRSRLGASAQDLGAAVTTVFGTVTPLDLPLGWGGRWMPLLGLVARA